MQSRVSEFLEENNLITDDQITDSVRRSSARSLRRLRQQLSRALAQFSKNRSPKSPFTFLASSAFRGERCCDRPDCRVGSVDLAAHFAALYADVLYLPLNIGQTEEQTNLLEGGLRVVAKLRPLVDAGIIVPIPDHPSLCKKCFEEGVSKTVFDQAEENIRLLIDKYSNDFEAEAHLHRFKGIEMIAYHITGPDDLIEGSSTYYLSENIPEWAQTYPSDTDVPLSHSQIEESGLIRRILIPSAKDYMLQSFTGNQLDSTFLTSQRGEAEFFALSSANHERLMQRSDALSRIAHELPSFGNLSIPQLIELRKREHLAFENYRNAMTTAINEADANLGSAPGIFGDIYNDVVRPQLDLLEAKDVEEKRRHRANLTNRALLGTFGAGFGALVSGLHPALGAAIAAGILCIDKTAADDLTGSLQSSPTVRSDSLYFLLKLRQTARAAEKN